MRTGGQGPRAKSQSAGVSAQPAIALHSRRAAIGLVRGLARGADAQPRGPRLRRKSRHRTGGRLPSAPIYVRLEGHALGSGAESGGRLPAAVGPALVRGRVGLLELLREIAGDRGLSRAGAKFSGRSSHAYRHGIHLQLRRRALLRSGNLGDLAGTPRLAAEPFVLLSERNQVAALFPSHRVFVGWHASGSGPSGSAPLTARSRAEPAIRLDGARQIEGRSSVPHSRRVAHGRSAGLLPKTISSIRK